MQQQLIEFQKLTISYVEKQETKVTQLESQISQLQEQVIQLHRQHLALQQKLSQKPQALNLAPKNDNYQYLLTPVQAASAMTGNVGSGPMLVDMASIHQQSQQMMINNQVSRNYAYNPLTSPTNLVFPQMSNFQVVNQNECTLQQGDASSSQISV